jgi:hypothetical protein
MNTHPLTTVLLATALVGAIAGVTQVVLGAICGVALAFEFLALAMEIGGDE